MIFISYIDGDFVIYDVNKYFTRLVLMALEEPLAQRLGQQWLEEAWAELEGTAGLDFSELSQEDFMFAYRILQEKSKDNETLDVLFDEIAPLLQADPRFTSL